MRIATIDAETNLSHDKVWVVWVHYWDTDNTVECLNAEELGRALQDVDVIAGWNTMGFDGPVIDRVWGTSITTKQQLDGMLLSQLYSPSRPGGHALASYGVQFSFPKHSFDKEDFDKGYTAKMSAYCEQDTRLATKAIQWLQDKLAAEHFSAESIELEHAVQRVLVRQRATGFLLDVAYANDVWAEITRHMLKLERDLQEVFPPITQKRFSEKTGKPLKDGVEVFNVGSRQQIYSRLLPLGAKFPKKTEKGSPVVDETTLEAIPLPEAQRILDYLILQKRLGQITNWLNAVEPDNRVRCRVTSNGAVTGRMTHAKPNLAQVTGVKKDKATGEPLRGLAGGYGYESRACWIVPEGKKLVGIDASGLELRMLAHYMKDDAYTKELLEGDVHTANMKAAGLSTRDQAKTFIYAFLYGAGDAKLGSITGGGAKRGRQLKQAFLANTPALDTLKGLVSDIADKHKSLPGLDGRRLRVRHKHAALNTLLQGAGAVVMKKAAVIFQQLLTEAGIAAEFVANVHDEWQMEVEEHLADAVGKLGVSAIVKAGEAYELRCPLDGEYNVGNNWAETH